MYIETYEFVKFFCEDQDITDLLETSTVNLTEIYERYGFKTVIKCLRNMRFNDYGLFLIDCMKKVAEPFQTDAVYHFCLSAVELYCKDHLYCDAIQFVEEQLLSGIKRQYSEIEKNKDYIKLLSTLSSLFKCIGDSNFVQLFLDDAIDLMIGTTKKDRIEVKTIIQDILEKHLYQ
jgi:hypothetical protein